MHRWSLVLVTLLVLAQAANEELKAKEEFKGKYEEPTEVPPPEPRDGFWAAPPGESGAARHAPRPGPGGAASDEGENAKPIEIGPTGATKP